MAGIHLIKIASHGKGAAGQFIAGHPVGGGIVSAFRERIPGDRQYLLHAQLIHQISCVPIHRRPHSAFVALIEMHPERAVIHRLLALGQPRGKGNRIGQEGWLCRFCSTRQQAQHQQQCKQKSRKTFHDSSPRQV